MWYETEKINKINSIIFEKFTLHENLAIVETILLNKTGKVRVGLEH